MTAATLVRSAREASRLSQAALGQRAGTSQAVVSFVENGERSPTSDTLERLLAGAGYLLIAVPFFGADALSTATRIARCLASFDNDAALRALIDYSDGLRRLVGANRVALTLGRPPRTGSPVWDAALAALVEQALGDDGLPVPDWVSDEDRYLDSPTELIPYPPLPQVDRAEVSAEFLRHNVLLERGTFASV